MLFFRTVVASTFALASVVHSLSFGHGHGHSGHEGHAARSLPKKHCNSSSTQERGTQQKVGIVYTGSDSGLLKAMKSSHANYFYNWRPSVPKQAKDAGFRVCSTLWGSGYVSQFKQVRTEYPCVIGFNEVNLGSQSNLSPGAAAAIWNQEVAFLANQGVEVIGPSTTTAPDGMQWMKDFFNACSKSAGPHCGISWLNLHYYGTDVNDFIMYMNKFHDQFGLPIMVTEFGCTDFSGKVHPSPSQVRDWMAGVVQWMEKTPWMGPYFAFGLTDGSLWGVSENARLLSGAKNLNDLGHSYINVQW